MSTRNYHSLTPTHHTTIPPTLDLRTTTLQSPFIAVITGAGKGLGKHITLAYAAAGATGLSISSRTAADLDALESEIRAVAKRRDVEVLKSVCNVQSEEDVRALEREVRERWGRVDVVVANAGVISEYVERKVGGRGDGEGEEGGSVESNLPIGIVEDEDWKRLLEINVFGVWRVCKAFLPLLESTTDGPQSIICSSSLAAHSTNSSICPIAYNVSKLSINRLMEHIANDHGAKGVHAFALHPGAVLTPQTQNHKGEVWSGLLSDDEGLAGAFCVWLTKEKRSWLSGRYVSCNWDVGELEAMKEEIVSGDLLKFRMAV